MRTKDRPKAVSVFMIRIRSGRECCDFATAIRHVANASKAEDHHGPGRRLGNGGNSFDVQERGVLQCGIHEQRSICPPIVAIMRGSNRKQRTADNKPLVSWVVRGGHHVGYCLRRKRYRELGEGALGNSCLAVARTGTQIIIDADAVLIARKRIDAAVIQRDHGN